MFKNMESIAKNNIHTEESRLTKGDKGLVCFDQEAFRRGWFSLLFYFFFIFFLDSQLNSFSNFTIYKVSKKKPPISPNPPPFPPPPQNHFLSSFAFPIPRSFIILIQSCNAFESLH